MWSLYLFQMIRPSSILPLPTHPLLCPHNLIPKLSFLPVTHLDSHQEADLLARMMPIMHLFGLLILNNVWPVIAYKIMKFGCSILALHFLNHRTPPLHHYSLRSSLLETRVTYKVPKGINAMLTSGGLTAHFTSHQTLASYQASRALKRIPWRLGGLH